MTRSAGAAWKAQAEAAGSLAAELPWWGWADERTCLTRRGELVTLARLLPKPTSGLSHEQVTDVAERWCRMLGQLDERTRLSLYALRRPLAWSGDGAGGIAGESARARAEFLSGRVAAAGSPGRGLGWPATAPARPGSATRSERPASACGRTWTHCAPWSRTSRRWRSCRRPRRPRCWRTW